jgi:hypothetical protein
VYVARKARGQSFLATLLQLTPIILFFAASYAWLQSPYSTILNNGGLMRIGLTMTFVFGRMTTKIILVYSLHLMLIIGTSHEATFSIFYQLDNTVVPPRHNHQYPLLYWDQCSHLWGCIGRAALAYASGRIFMSLGIPCACGCGLL